MQSNVRPESMARITTKELADAFIAERRNDRQDGIQKSVMQCGNPVQNLKFCYYQIAYACAVWP